MYMQSDYTIPQVSKDSNIIKPLWVIQGPKGWVVCQRWHRHQWQTLKQIPVPMVSSPLFSDKLHNLFLAGGGGESLMREAVKRDTWFGGSKMWKEDGQILKGKCHHFCNNPLHSTWYIPGSLRYIINIDSLLLIKNHVNKADTVNNNPTLKMQTLRPKEVI